MPAWLSNQFEKAGTDARVDRNQQSVEPPGRACANPPSCGLLSGVAAVERVVGELIVNTQSSAMVRSERNEMDQITSNGPSHSS